MWLASVSALLLTTPAPIGEVDGGPPYLNHYDNLAQRNQVRAVKTTYEFCALTMTT